jgi:hypothetical protein
MFTVTEAAGLRLAQKLTYKHAADDMAMRFERKSRKWKLRLDLPSPDDLAVAHEGRTVLVLDPEMADRLTDRTLDARATPAGARLYLR